MSIYNTMQHWCNYYQPRKSGFEFNSTSYLKRCAHALYDLLEYMYNENPKFSQHIYRNVSPICECYKIHYNNYGGIIILNIEPDGIEILLCNKDGKQINCMRMYSCIRKIINYLKSYINKRDDNNEFFTWLFLAGIDIDKWEKRSKYYTKEEIDDEI